MSYGFDSNALARNRHYGLLLILLAAGSFLLYATGVLMLRQDRLPGWALEAAGAIPAAASYLKYDAPLGAVDTNVLKKFLTRNGASVQDILAEAATKSIPHGTISATTLDGNSAGMNLFATAAMSAFGMRILALVLLYLAIIGISTVAFVLRFHDRRLLVLPLYFLALTAMLLTPLGISDLAVDQMPIGGPRYFAVAALLPALHIFFDIIDHASAVERKRKALNSLLLFIQALVLLMALWVRNSTGYLVLVLFAVWAWTIFRDRRQPAQFRAVLRKTAILAGAWAISSVAIVTTVPAYVHNDRLFPDFWHRAFVGLAFHPDWPFGDLREVYDCTRYFPEGLTKKRADLDHNGHCVWMVYPPNAKRPFDEVARGTYGGEYQTAVRQAYFYVLTHYPRQVFELYAVVKTKMIGGVLVTALDWLSTFYRAPVAKPLLFVVVAQFILFAAFAVAIAIRDRTVVDARMMIFPTFFLASLLPLYAAWATIFTSSDTTVLMYACIVLALLLLLQLCAGLRGRAPKLDDKGPIAQELSVERGFIP